MCNDRREPLTLSYEEHEQIVRRCVEHVAGRVPVIAGKRAATTQKMR